MDVLATVRRLLVAIIILLCAVSAPAISTPTAGALYSQNNLAQHTEARTAPQAQPLSSLASVTSEARRPITSNFVSEPEIAPTQWKSIVTSNRGKLQERLVATRAISSRKLLPACPR